MNRAALSILTLLVCAFSVHCGGGGGNTIIGPVIPPTTDPMFVGDPACPGAMAVSMQPGDVNGATFEIEIMLTGDIDDFLGAGFGISVTGATFVGIDMTAASLLDGFADNQKQIQALARPGGEVEVVAELLDSTLVFTPSATTPLVTLQFTATADGAIDFLAPPESEIRICPTPTTCAPAAVTWCGGDLTI